MQESGWTRRKLLQRCYRERRVVMGSMSALFFAWAVLLFVYVWASRMSRRPLFGNRQLLKEHFQWTPLQPRDWSNDTFGELTSEDDRVLANGVQLPRAWPPHEVEFRRFWQREQESPQTSVWPSARCIDQGRQLFVDEFLIQHRDGNVQWLFHPLESLQPVVAPEQPWETGVSCRVSGAAGNPGAVWYDTSQRLYRMWYSCGCLIPASSAGASNEYSAGGACHATSADGVTWAKTVIPRPAMNPDDDGDDSLDRHRQRPQDPRRPDQVWDHLLHLFGPNNILPTPELQVPGSANLQVGVWMNDEAEEAAHRFALIMRASHSTIMWSEDGLGWRRMQHAGIKCFNRCAFFYNPFRRVWGYSLRYNACRELNRARIALYAETRDLDVAYADYMRRYLSLSGLACHNLDERGSPVFWMRDDSRDTIALPTPDNPTGPGVYSSNSIAYESLLMTMVDVFRGGHHVRKVVDLHVAFSRDGFHHARAPHRRSDSPYRAFVSDDRAGRRYLECMMGGVIVHPDRLQIYFSAMSSRDEDQVDTSPPPHDGPPEMTQYVRRNWLGELRRDGFASMSTGNNATRVPKGEACVTTTPVVFHQPARYLFVNVAAGSRGQLRVGVLRPGRANTVMPFAVTASMPIQQDSSRVQVQWKDVPPEAFAALRGRPIRFRFCLTGQVDLYSFWVSDSATGSSGGYLGAGGPEYPGLQDV